MKASHEKIFNLGDTSLKVCAQMLTTSRGIDCQIEVVHICHTSTDNRYWSHIKSDQALNLITPEQLHSVELALWQQLKPIEPVTFL